MAVPHRTESHSIAVLGAGSWGTALAHLLGVNGHRVALWDRDQALVEHIAASGTNAKYLPDAALPANITPTHSLQEALVNVEWVIVAVPSGAIRDVISEAGEHLSAATAILSAAKGLEAETGFTMSEVIALLLQDVPHAGIVALSGPNLAHEVVRRIPSASVCASSDIALARRAQEILMSPHVFRVYTHADVRGVELGGALKNVLAIGAGISDGLGFGDNTKAALMTRGLMEMTQMGIAAGAKSLTFLGLAGVGDLMATAAGRLSRNYRVGLGLADHKPLADVLRELGQVAEGVATAKAARLLSRRYDIETPLFDAIHDVLYAGKAPQATVEELMSRPARDEFTTETA
ncbi:MAG TPA: NAD(P)H-dependent glycerol-3-phosphate dehydrogenase [Capsulimonadaceae bacterium]|nr:NAD(P)H-dependent glycerol-3-phosphate dehydrogenase [Capsulimonadaceae bacterium]